MNHTVATFTVNVFFALFLISRPNTDCRSLKDIVPFERACSEFEFNSSVVSKGQFSNQLNFEHLNPIAGDFSQTYSVSDSELSLAEKTVEVKHRFFQAADDICLNAKEAMLTVRFEDDTLNSFVLQGYFEPDNIRQCAADYARLCNIVKPSFPNNKELKWYSWWDDNAHIGYYTTFCKGECDVENDLDLEFVRVQYKAQRKVIMDETEQGYHYGAIDHYILSIEYNDYASTRSENLKHLEEK